MILLEPLRLRIAEDGDLNALNDLQRNCYPPSFHEDPDVFLTMVNRRMSLVLYRPAADGTQLTQLHPELSGEIIGYALVHGLQDPDKLPCLNTAEEVGPDAGEDDKDEGPSATMHKAVDIDSCPTGTITLESTATDARASGGGEVQCRLPSTFNGHVFIHDVSVHPEWRRKGLASAMVKKLLHLSLAADSVSLISVQGSGPFWECHGFRPSGRALDCLSSYGPDAVHMELVMKLNRGEDPVLEAASLETIAEAFSIADTGSAFYVGESGGEVEQDPVGRVPAKWKEFWRRLAFDTLAGAPPEEKVLFLTRAGESVAICSLWQPARVTSGEGASKEAGVVQALDETWTGASYSGLLSAEGAKCFADCHLPGGLWDQACSDLYARKGAFYSLDFLATRPRSAGRGLASLLLGLITKRADKEGRATFLVATGPRLRDWYRDQMAFVETKHFRYESASSQDPVSLEGSVVGDGVSAMKRGMRTADLYFMERMPRSH